MTENEREDYLRVETMEILIEHDDVIVESEDEIHEIFNLFISSDLEFNNFDEYFQRASWLFRGRVDEEEAGDIATALINATGNMEALAVDELHDRADSELARLLQRLAAKYNLDLQRTISRWRQGREYWTNIKSSAAFRSGIPTFYHELIIDHNEVLTFNSSVRANQIIARHMIEQLTSLPDQLGEEALQYVDSEEIELIEDELESLQEKLEDLEASSESVATSDQDDQEKNGESEIHGSEEGVKEELDEE